MENTFDNVQTQNIHFELDPSVKYKRVIIKLSGEALAGDDTGMGIDMRKLDYVCDQIADIRKLGVEIGIVIGGGNFWRGRQADEKMNRSTADHMGMLATVMNALAIQDRLEQHGIPVRVQTALTITKVAEPYILRKAVRHFEKCRIVIFACGTGNPYFSTDTTTTLRAIEIEADMILLAKAVDGVYDSDPKLNPEAKKYDELSIQSVIDQKLGVMDLTASIMCMENRMPVLVFGLNGEDSIIRAVRGEAAGTKVTV